MTDKKNSKYNGRGNGADARQTSEIDLFTPELANTPGWNELSPEKQDSIASITDTLLHFRKLEGQGIVGQCMQLVRIKRELEGQPMTITDYVKHIYGSGDRTAWRRLADFEAIRKYIPEVYQRDLASPEGTEIFKGATAQLKSLIEVVKQSPPPPNAKREERNEYWLDVREKMRERKREAKKKGQISFDRETAHTLALRGLLNIMNRSNLQTNAERTKWLKRVMGYAMWQLALAGTLEVSPIAIPEGMIAKRGRRPKSKTH